MSETKWTDYLPPDVADFVKEELARGTYASESDIVESALRLLRRDREETIEALNSGLADVASGRFKPLADVVAEIQHEPDLADAE